MCTPVHAQVRPPELKLSEAELDWVGEQIFHNECAGKTPCLVHWNVGEAFPSLGIGHFIWYPAGTTGPFVESFPGLIRFMRDEGVALPELLSDLEPFAAPWPDREAFIAQQGSAAVGELRRFLHQTQGLQAAFIFARAQSALGRILAAVPADERPAIHDRLAALSTTPGGVYALIDYVNFKGEGLAPGETYHGEGWGLLQVLRQMPQESGATALERFRQAAGKVLTRRADNAERAIEKEQWLSGWLNRLRSYREPTR